MNEQTREYVVFWAFFGLFAGIGFREIQDCLATRWPNRKREQRVALGAYVVLIVLFDAPWPTEWFEHFDLFNAE